MKRFPPPDNWTRWELWVRPEATGGKWSLRATGTFAECIDAMGGAGIEYSIRRAA